MLEPARGQSGEMKGPNSRPGLLMGGPTFLLSPKGSSLLARVAIHMVFSTKRRRPFIQGDLRSEVNAYLTGALKNLGCPVLAVNCVADHVHVLCLLSRDLSLSELFEETKKRGLLVGKGGLHGNVIRISPPMMVGESEIDEALEILGQSFDALGA